MQDFMAFTRKFSGKTNVLFTPIGVSQAFTPSPDLKVKPSISETTAIWDTGATCSVISKSLASQMGLIATGKTQITGVNGLTNENTYMVNIYLPNKVCVAYVKIAEVPAISGNAEMLIGMDIIGAGDLSIYTENDRTVMSFRFPSVGGQDFVVEAQKIRAKKTQVAITQKSGLRKPVNKALVRKTRKKRDGIR
jgi:hypothetical protein